MVLQYKFKYLSANKTLAKFLDFTAKQFDCEYKILREKDNICLYIDNSIDIVEDFSNVLSATLPMSLFYYDIKVNVVPSMPKVASIDLNDETKISFCPSCLKEVEDEKSKDYYNAFKSCEICDGFENAKFLLDTKEVESNKELFSNLAKLINDGKKIKIKTLSGEFVFSKLQHVDSSSNLLVTDLLKLSKMLVENKTDIVALASIEKPSIDFKINEIYKHKHDVKKDYINVRFVNDLTLFLLSLELVQYEIDFLNIEKSDAEFNYFLDVESVSSSENIIDIPKVKCFETKKIFIENQSYPKNLDLIYNKFEEKNKAHFMTVLAEHNLFDKSIANFYISTLDDDGLSMYSSKFDGLIDITKTFETPKNIKEVFEKIEKEESGERLLKNYKEKFPSDYEKAINTDISSYNSKSFYNYWAIAKIALNFENDILDNANTCLLEKGPRIDYKLKENDSLYDREFEYEKLIKSALSFKLAGVEEETISLGYIESLAHFIANEIDYINGSYDLDGVSLCGDMFTYDIFTSLVEKSITKNFNIYYNREFVIQK